MTARDKALRGLADVLTGGRLVIAGVIAIAAYRADWNLVALLLSLAWWSDFSDGRLARRAGGGTRLGAWDLRVDTAVGAMLLVGMTLGAHISIVWGVVGAGLGFGYILTANGSLAMLLQAIAYGHALRLSAVEGFPGFVAATVTIGVILVSSWPRFVQEVVPTFLRGLVGDRRVESEPRSDG